MTKEELYADLQRYTQALQEVQQELRLIRREASIAGVVDYLQRKMAEMEKVREEGTLPFPTSKEQQEGSES